MPIPLGILAQAGRTISSGSYELITSQILTGSQTSVTFSNLGDYASTYKHLQLRVVARDTRSASLSFYRLRFNSDSGANYQFHRLMGTGSSVISGAFTGTTEVMPGYVASASSASGVFGATIIDVLDAFSSTKFKTTRSLTGFGGAVEFGLFSGCWRNTNSITSLSFVTESGDFIANSRFSIYGVK